MDMGYINRRAIHIGSHQSHLRQMTQFGSESDDMSVRVWDALSSDLKVFKGYTRLVKSVANSPDSKQIVSGSWDDLVWMWNALAWQRVEGPQH